MESTKINKLLEKYFEAETTTAEEAQLKRYFSQTDIADEHLPYQPMFAHFNAQKTTESPAWKPIVKQKPLRKWLSIAASLAIVVSAGIWQQQNNRQKEAALLYEQTKNALEMVSINFNSGAQEISHLKTFDKTISEIFD
ncbi:MAG: hypothetical protein RQ735_00930 [Flavobacteriaceae bacterium]|nr:hypothetical protein [Flavobacteriaceae bacterium]